MAFTATKKIVRAENVGSGMRGTNVALHVALAAGVAQNVYLPDGLKFKDPDHVVVLEGSAHTNGSAEAVNANAMDELPIVAASGDYITLEDSTGGDFSMVIFAELTER